MDWAGLVYLLSARRLGAVVFYLGGQRTSDLRESRKDLGDLKTTEPIIRRGEGVTAVVMQ